MKQDINIENLKMDINTMAEYEIITGKTIPELFETMKIGINDLRSLIQGGFGIGKEEAGNLLQNYLKENGFEKLINIFTDKLKNSGLLGDEEEKK